MPRPRDEWVVIRRYADPVRGEVDRAVLSAHDIESRLQRDDAGGMLPALLWSVEARLLVPWRDAVRALAILDQGEAEPARAG